MLKGWSELKFLFFESIVEAVVPIIDSNMVKYEPSVTFASSMKGSYRPMFCNLKWCVDLEVDEDALFEIVIVDDIDIVIGMGLNTWNTFKDNHYKILKELEIAIWDKVQPDLKTKQLKNIYLEKGYTRESTNLLSTHLYAKLRECKSTGWF